MMREIVTGEVRVGARRLAAAIAIALTALLTAGCGSTASEAADAVAPVDTFTPLAELAVSDDPRSLEGPSTAALTDAAIVPVTEGPVQELPAQASSVEQSGTQAITITDTSRVIAMDLSGSIAATVWGLGFGDRLIARDQSTTFPGTEDLEVITTGGHSVNAEAIIALEPTLVITDGTVGPRDVVEQLRDVGIQVVFVENDASFAGAEQLARDVAAVFGAAQAGEALAQRIAADVAQTEAEIAEIAPAGTDNRVRMMFLYLRGSAGIYYLFGEGSGADELIDALGGVDVAAELGWDGMKPLTDEAMVAADPDLILVMTAGIESVGGVDALLEEKPAIAITAAGEHRRFVDMADGDILSFGPRSAEVLDALARAIYAPDSAS